MSSSTELLKHMAKNKLTKSLGRKSEEERLAHSQQKKILSLENQVEQYEELLQASENRVKEQEIVIKNLERSLESEQKKHVTALSQVTNEAFCRGLSSERLTQYRSAFSRGEKKGAQLCRAHILACPAGQSLLRRLVADLPEAYLNSSEFRERMADILATWVVEAITETCTQLGIAERWNEVDGQKVLSHILNYFPGAELNSPAGGDHLWFLDTLKKGAEEFITCPASYSSHEIPRGLAFLPAQSENPEEITRLCNLLNSVNAC